MSTISVELYIFKVKHKKSPGMYKIKMCCTMLGGGRFSIAWNFIIVYVENVIALLFMYFIVQFSWIYKIIFYICQHLFHLSG